MLRYVVPLILLASTASGISYNSLKYSAASPAQIRFAVENKYDDTGPGAKQPDYAYHTYKNLDDALVAYLDDPDTKLPEHERARAIANLYKPTSFDGDNFIPNPTRVDAFTGNKLKVVPIVLSTYNKYDVEPKGLMTAYELKGLHSNDADRNRDPYKWQKERAVKSSRLSISHYNKNDNDPQTFSYDVPTNESPDRTELRDESGAVAGSYTVVQPDGRRRTVHYHADPQRGFRSSVQRIFS
uniref:Uncharacterized protein n=1 Tax=Pectinophora gossypiella TaxID=13191 RepID=A0A1E1WTL8_PECGO